MLAVKETPTRKRDDTRCENIFCIITKCLISFALGEDLDGKIFEERQVRSPSPRSLFSSIAFKTYPRNKMQE